jgi:prevent-host-death family protein
MKIVNSYEAKTHLSQLIRQALEGERIVIARAGTPLVELKPYQEQKRRAGGIWEGQVRMAEDFEEPLEDLEEAIYGKDSST